MPLTDPSHDLELLTAMRAVGSGTAATAVTAADAFNALYRRHQGPLFRYALLRSGREDVAADIVQDVFLGLMTNTFKFDATRGSLQPFLFGVARNLLLKRDEAARRFVSTTAKNDGDEDAEDLVAFVADNSMLPEQRVLANETAEQVRRALTQVAPHYRDVLILYEIHDLSYVEIAHICGIDLGTVRSRLSRARAKLTELLTPTQTPSFAGNGNATHASPAAEQALPITSFIKNNNDEYQRKFERDFDHG
jgi:RNA polymerase sigma-70 factor, ECF subfamily